MEWLSKKELMELEHGSLLELDDGETSASWKAGLRLMQNVSPFQIEGFLHVRELLQSSGSPIEDGGGHELFDEYSYLSVIKASAASNLPFSASREATFDSKVAGSPDSRPIFDYPMTSCPCYSYAPSPHPIKT
ncbi:hypothetical protein Tco_1227222 [Tanacetum coccineum]